MVTLNYQMAWLEPLGNKGCEYVSQSTLLQQGWKEAKDLWLVEQENSIGIALLEDCKSITQLRGEEDTVVWSQNPNWKYTTSLRYKSLFLEEHKDKCWWWKSLWKLKEPIKYIFIDYYLFALSFHFLWSTKKPTQPPS